MKADRTAHHITDYERAVCYYTLPRVVSPLTYGLLIAYGVCLLEAVAALVYGLVTDHRGWTIGGALAFAGIVVFGMVAFTIRALMNDWNKRAALAAARHVPDGTASDDIPDPFSGHLLLMRPQENAGNTFTCVTNTGEIAYHVELSQDKKHWRVYTEDGPAFEILIEQNMLHPGLLGGQPLRLGVFAEKKKIAAVARRNALCADVVDVFSLAPSHVQYTVKNDCITLSDRLIGRIYEFDGFVYLDVELEHATPGLLAHFMTMT